MIILATCHPHSNYLKMARYCDAQRELIQKLRVVIRTRYIYFQFLENPWKSNIRNVDQVKEEYISMIANM